MNITARIPSLHQKAYVEALLHYFAHQTNQLRVVLEEKIESFCCEFEDPQLAYDQFLMVIKKLECNNIETWSELQKEVTHVFHNDREMKDLFLAIAKERNIPTLRFTT